MSGYNLPEEYMEAWCEIKTAENVLIGIGRVTKIEEKYIIIADKSKELPVVEPGTLMKINLFSPGKEIRVCIGNMYISSKSEISIVNVLSFVYSEKRNFLRMDTSIETTASYRLNPRNLYPDETEVIVKDMSLSGMRFESETVFPINTIVGVNLKLKGKKEYCIKCQVVRLIGTTNEGFYNYGSKIIFEQDESSELFCSYMFEQEREFIKRK